MVETGESLSIVKSGHGRTRILLYVVSVSFIITGIWLLKEFLEQPMGSIPGMPGTWRGAPLLLSASFLTISGALMVILRRFSLAAILATGILSTGFATGMQAYVKSIRETVYEAYSVEIEASKSDQFIRELRECVSDTRLDALAADLYRDKFVRSIDYESATVSFGASNDGAIVIKTNFSYCPYIHNSRSGVRDIIHSYVRFAARLKADRLTYYPLGSFERRYSYERNLLEYSLTRGRYFERLDRIKLERDGFTCFAQRETDQDLKEFFERVAELKNAKLKY